jgi:hypothetical protein
MRREPVSRRDAIAQLKAARAALRRHENGGGFREREGWKTVATLAVVALATGALAWAGHGWMAGKAQNPALPQLSAGWRFAIEASAYVPAAIVADLGLIVALRMWGRGARKALTNARSGHGAYARWHERRDELKSKEAAAMEAVARSE